MLFRMPLHRQMRHGLPLSSRIAPPMTSFWPDGETVRDDGLPPTLEKAQPIETNQFIEASAGGTPKWVRPHQLAFQTAILKLANSRVDKFASLSRPTQADGPFSPLEPLRSRSFASSSPLSLDQDPGIPVMRSCERQGGAVASIGAIIKVHCVRAEFGKGRETRQMML
ncbi:hypothetical protein BKA70DRAFT_1407890 [Coprinopsis sp. MPI-PUGE-AT-0042]|nr:hypothetical protein BKA70DRAFT_1407890 [Coprinopsis sp. MPI-PUGE-AT-0042]